MKKTTKTEQSDNDKLISALRKRAIGYEVSEHITEYDSEGNIIKDKITTKDVPPDLSAIKLLLELSGESNVESLTEEELVGERDRLLAVLRADIGTHSDCV